MNVDADVRYCCSCFIFLHNSIMQKNRVQGQRENNALVVEKKKKKRRGENGKRNYVDIYVALSVIELELHLQVRNCEALNRESFLFFSTA